jgi:hypothetical protein
LSLLTIIQGAARRCRLTTVPTSVVSNTDPDVQQLFGFAQDTAIDLVDRWDWTNLKVQFQIVGDGVTTIFGLPPDWQRICPSDKSPMGALISSSRPTLPLIGPVNDEWLNAQKALPAALPMPVWRRIGSALEIWPALALNETVTSWYISNYYAVDPNYTRKQFSADTDTALVGEDTVMKGTVWRWLASKGLDYAERFREYELALDRSAGQENQERVISTTAIGGPNMDTFWPGTISYVPP